MLTLYNTKSRSLEPFHEIKPGVVMMYHCGPTVYDFVHIGNLRSIVISDIFRRSLEYLGYEVRQIMNITDVGHLVNDGDIGDDKMTKALRKKDMEITTANMLSIAREYERHFKADAAALGMIPPMRFPRASDHIQGNITMIAALIEKDFAYIGETGVYFDTQNYADYGKFGLSATLECASPNQEKKHTRDFALWKFDTENGWSSPWGHGFPGWHIECSVMAKQHLATTIDIHTGGSDHIAIHHTNEIAQSEASSGETFANYWLHHEMLNVDGGKMGKSLGNAYDLRAIEAKNFSAMDLRYFYLQAHYRSKQNFTWQALEASSVARIRLLRAYMNLGGAILRFDVLGETANVFELRFKKVLAEDFGTPKALALVYEVLKNQELTDSEKKTLLANFDRVLGLKFSEAKKELSKNKEQLAIPKEILAIVSRRDLARAEKQWELSDTLRLELEDAGYEVTDSKDQTEILKSNQK